MKEIGNISNATIYFDEEKNMYYCISDMSKGFYFDGNDYTAFTSFQKEEIINLLSLGE